MDVHKDIIARLKDFIESEARSCSMDPGCITPEYVYRMWGGSVTLEEIEVAMKEIKNLLRMVYNERKIEMKL